jgi:hypothetical protein
MEEEIDMNSDDMWGEWDAACMKVLDDLHNNTRRIGERARMLPKDSEEQAA